MSAAGGKPRRLLVLCYFFPPLAGGGVHRVLSFVRELPRLGWNCTVIAAGREDYWVTDDTLEARIPAATEVIRVSGGSALSTWLRLRGRRAAGRRKGSTFSLLRRLSDWWLLPDAYAGWIAGARRAAEARLARGDIDALLSTSPPDSVHLAALAARRTHPVPWIADFRDPWMGLTLRQPPSAWHRARQKALERSVLEGADRVLVASRTHAEDLKSEGVKTRGVVHLPNGFAPDAEGESGAVEAAPAGATAGRFLAVFTGTLSMMPETEVFLEALHDLLARRPELRRRFRAKLAGPFDTGYEDRAVALGLTGIVEFTGPLTHGASRALQREADVLLLWKPRSMPTMVPGKLYEYLDAGRPLLAVLPAGDEAATLAERGGATRIDPGDREALGRALEAVVDRRDAEGRAPVTRPAWLHEHARPALARRLADALESVMAEARR